MFKYKSVLRLNITSDLVGGGVLQDLGDGAHEEAAQDSTIHCDLPDIDIYVTYGCSALHCSNQRPNRTLIYSRLKARG